MTLDYESQEKKPRPQRYLWIVIALLAGAAALLFANYENAAAIWWNILKPFYPTSL